MAGYTPKQRETFLKGFRILADVAVRAHIERQAPASSRDVTRIAGADRGGGLMPDCATFADTRREPPSVYEHMQCPRDRPELPLVDHGQQA